MTVTVVRLGGRPDQPLLVLGPDRGASATDTWGEVAPALGEHFQVLAWDLPGHGHNTATGAWTPDSLAADLLALLDENDALAGARFHHAGVGVGAEVGEALRALDPDRVVDLTAGSDPLAVLATLLGEGPGVYAATGVFVCFEGGEGSGKSTQSRLLREHLESLGHEVMLTFEPGDTAVGAQLRRIVLSPETGALADRTEALLYAADKAEHVETLVRPALERGAVVITDRYVDSTLAYQGAGRTLPVEEVEQVARWATGDLRPHLTVVLDLEPAAGLGRFEGRDRIEGESLEFHQRVRAAFTRMAAADPAHYLVLDARLPVEEIAARVQARVAPLLERAR